MKNLITITLVALVIFTSSCGLKEVVGPNAEGGTTNSDSYQPVVKGSTWKYSIQVVNQTALQQETITMTGDTKTINGTLYYKALAATATDSANGYFGHNGNVYYSYDEDDNLAEPYLDDTKPVGATFVIAVTDPSIPTGTSAQYLLTILEKGISKTVNGKTYNNVIHTSSELQYSFGSGFITSDKSEYYVAKGIGIIQTDAYFGGALIASQTLVSYNIK